MSAVYSIDLPAFMARVEFEPNTGCWLWNGAPGAGGYGVARWDGRNQKAHRVSWALHHDGEMPPPHIKACHSCDTPACVNPDHLWLGTQIDNIADMVAKGRHRAPSGRFGTRSSRARLDEYRVWQIREIIKLEVVTQRVIAECYGVSYMTISRIATGQSWPHVGPDWPELNPMLRAA